MNILLDNCVPVRARALFAHHDVTHVLDRGWDGLSNGRLIAATVDARFDVLVTVDKNIKHQQHLERLAVSVLELDVPNNRLDTIQKVGVFLPAALLLTQKFRFVSVDLNGNIVTLAPK